MWHSAYDNTLQQLLPASTVASTVAHYTSCSAALSAVYDTNLPLSSTAVANTVLSALVQQLQFVNTPLLDNCSHIMSCVQLAVVVAQLW
jgi:hypothetical protein